MRIAVYGDALHVELNWWQKLLAFHFSTLQIPIDHIDRIGTERVKTHWKEIRFPGAFIPGLVKAGTYRRAGRRDFWCVTAGQPVLRLDLKSEYFDSLTLGMEDNERWIREIGKRVAV